MVKLEIILNHICTHFLSVHLLRLLDLELLGAGCSLSISVSPSGIRPLSSSWHQRWYLRSSSRRAMLAFSRSRIKPSKYWYLKKHKKMQMYVGKVPLPFSF